MFGEMEYHSYRIDRENKPLTIYELVKCFLLIRNSTLAAWKPKRLFKLLINYTISEKRTFSITEAVHDFSLAWVIYSLKKIIIIISETELILFMFFIISTFVIELIQLYRHSFCPLILNVGRNFYFFCHFEARHSQTLFTFTLRKVIRIWLKILLFVFHRTEEIKSYRGDTKEDTRGRVNYDHFNSCMNYFFKTQCQVEENAEVSLSTQTHTHSQNSLKEVAKGCAQSEMQQYAFINSITPQFSEASQCPHYHSGFGWHPFARLPIWGHTAFNGRLSLHPAHMAVLNHPSFFFFIIITKPHGSLGLLLEVFCWVAALFIFPSVPDP